MNLAAEYLTVLWNFFAFRLFNDIARTVHESKSTETVQNEKQCKEEELRESEKDNKIIVDDEDVTVVLEKNNDKLKKESSTSEEKKEEICNGTKEGKYLLYCLAQCSSFTIFFMILTEFLFWATFCITLKITL